MRKQGTIKKRRKRQRRKKKRNPGAKADCQGAFFKNTPTILPASFSKLIKIPSNLKPSFFVNPCRG